MFGHLRWIQWTTYSGTMISTTLLWKFININLCKQNLLVSYIQNSMNDPQYSSNALSLKSWNIIGKVTFHLWSVVDMRFPEVLQVIWSSSFLNFIQVHQNFYWCSLPFSLSAMIFLWTNGSFVGQLNWQDVNHTCENPVHISL